MMQTLEKQNVHSTLRFAALLALMFPLAACALADIASSPPPRFFMLTAAHPTPPEGSVVAHSQVLIDEFSAPAALDTARIAYQPNPNELQYYADARWSDLAPKMIQGLLVETSQNTGCFSAVAASGTDLRGDYTLAGDIRAFSAAPDASGTSTVHVSFLVRLVRAEDRSIVASKIFEASVAATGSGISPIIAAYDIALRQVLDGISLWTLAQISTPISPPQAASSSTLSAPDIDGRP